MTSKDKALKKKIANEVVVKIKDSKGVKPKLPYKFLKALGAKDEK